MKRRDVLKGAAVVAGAAVVGLPAVAKGEALPLLNTTYSGKTRRMMVELFVYPKQGGPLKPRFQELIEEWERTNADFRPIEAVFFGPQTEDGSPWLVHPAWDREPMSKDNLSLLHTESRIIFRDRRWDIIERAIDLREMGYWRQKYMPEIQSYGAAGLAGGGMSFGTSYYRMFRRAARNRLYRVRVHFEAIPLSEFRRFLGVTAPEYARLQDELEGLVNLHKKGKISPQAYLKGRMERYERMEQLEAAALKWG